jgi:hypothetical protein
MLQLAWNAFRNEFGIQSRTRELDWHFQELIWTEIVREQEDKGKAE